MRSETVMNKPEKNDKTDKKIRLEISGRVQGVFYRVSTRDEARRLGLTGWVRNLRDGRVEAFVRGSEQRLDQLIAWCRLGPSGAVVEEVMVHWLDEEAPDFESLQGDREDFEIIATF